ncbi:peptidoglycan-binding protein [Kitasatospora sp. NPDC050543]|uniref:peptidoglycan-binding protein n=1 Tax=Kitasatospora sp. NPDC050543 TaxID=3364054 RepID=UPI00379878ED
MFKKIAAKTAVVLGAATLAIGGLSSTASAAEGASYVSRGSSGAGAWCVQHLVNDVARKAGRATIGEDSQFGPATQDQVKWFQDRLGLKPDGIVGPNTGNYLLYFGDQYYGGLSGYCFTYVPSDGLGGMYVPTHLD